jgi:uncharacterized protein CbrC (UPF0167 family)
MSEQSEKIVRELEQAVAEVKAETAERLLEKVRERTPVRTGYTQSRWQLTEDGVSNDQGEVIMRLNDGSSTQVAAGFIEQAIDETVVEMQQEVDKP